MDSVYKEKVTEHVVHIVAPGEDDASDVVAIDPDLERRCWRKFDMLVMPQLFLLILLGYLDRSNIGNARVMGLETDVGLTGTQFNNIGSFFFVSYAIFQIPWALVIKWIGANRALAIATVGWSVITIGTGLCRTYDQMIACRLLLGFFEAALGAAEPLLIGNIYPRSMQSKRMAAMFYGICVSGAFGGLIAYGVQVMGDRLGLSAWRWLFIIEGAISLFFGLVTWLSFPAKPQTAWFLTPEEKDTMVAIRNREMTYRGEEKFDWKYLRITVLDPTIWLVALTGFVSAFPVLGFSLFAPTLILSMGYTRLEANYLSVPLYAVATLSLVLFTYVSDRINRRGVMIIIPACFAALGYAIAVGQNNPRVGFMAMFFVAAGIYPMGVLHISWVSNNMAPDSKRTVAIPILMSFVVVSGVMSAQIYPAEDAPHYTMGNAISLCGNAAAGSGALLLWFIWRRRNAHKSKLQAEGSTVNRYEDDRGLDFKYVL